MPDRLAADVGVEANLTSMVRARANIPPTPRPSRAAHSQGAAVGARPIAASMAVATPTHRATQGRWSPVRSARAGMARAENTWVRLNSPSSSPPRLAVQPASRDSGDRQGRGAWEGSDGAPRYRVIRQATPLPQGSRARPGPGSAAARSRRVAGTQ